MAQEKEVKEKPKRTRKTQKSAKEKPYVEQINELLFVHNKEDPKAGVQAVSEIDGEGKVRTVPAEEKNENSFLKFEKNSSILENFIRNFWSQLKEPTHFRLIRMTIHDYKQNRQAIKDLSQGKETDAVKEFLKRYEIRPRENKEQSKNEKETETMAKKQKSNPQEQVPQPTVSTGQPQEQQAPRYRYDENMVNWDALEKMGVSKTSLEQQGLLDSMLKGYKTNKLVPLTLTLTGARVKLDARLSFITMPDGQIGLGIHGIRKEPELERPYFGHIFTEEDKKNLRETGNMGRVAELNLNGGSYTPCLISIDKNTNELVAVRQENVYIPSEVKGIRLTADEINALKEGQPVYVDGMTSKNGKPFDATLQYSAERRGLEYLSEVGLCARDYVNREVNASLSGGELKRIEIATMLARGTKMSIFDEPEAGIDLWSFQNLISVFEKMHETIHGSILIISHQERILETADKIVVLVDGEIRAIGSKDEIMPVLMQASSVCSRLADKV